MNITSVSFNLRVFSSENQKNWVDSLLINRFGLLVFMFFLIQINKRSCGICKSWVMVWICSKEPSKQITQHIFRLQKEIQSIKKQSENSVANFFSFILLGQINS